MHLAQLQVSPKRGKGKTRQWSAGKRTRSSEKQFKSY